MNIWKLSKLLDRGFDELVSTDYDEHKANIKIKNAINIFRKITQLDLNMAVVSNYVSMNYYLFSFTFKQYTGTNFVNYLKGYQNWRS